MTFIDPDFIPGDPTWQSREDVRSQSLDYREPDPDLISPEGATTVNYDRSTRSLVVKCNRNAIEPRLIKKGLEQVYEGGDDVAVIVLLLSAQNMQDEIGWLTFHNFDREPDTSPKQSLYRWTRKIKPRKKTGEPTA